MSTARGQGAGGLGATDGGGQRAQIERRGRPARDERVEHGDEVPAQLQRSSELGLRAACEPASVEKPSVLPPGGEVPRAAQQVDGTRSAAILDRVQEVERGISTDELEGRDRIHCGSVPAKRC